jgi:lysyl endopeptidase
LRYHRPCSGRATHPHFIKLTAAKVKTFNLQPSTFDNDPFNLPYGENLVNKSTRLFIIAFLTLLLFLLGSTLRDGGFSDRLAPVAHAEAGPLAERLPQSERSLAQVSRLSLPAPDVAALLREDELRRGQDLPPRFAQPLPVHVTPATHGDWETLADGSLLWRLRVEALGALSLNLGFNRYRLPENGRLYLYTPDYKQMIRPFTAADNKEHGQLWTPILPGSEVVVAVTLPAAERHGLELLLTAVNYGYQEFGRSTRSGSCNVDVVCPEGDDWRDQIRSVAVISTGGSTFCTGFMVNNTAQDLTPYFMTARHCGVSAGNAPSLVVYWNFENSICREVDTPGNGGPGDGSLSQFQTGSTFRAAYLPSDFTLVELDDEPDPAFNVYWAGWDATSDDSLWAVGIHHPRTNEKRISFEYNPTTTTSYLGHTSPGEGTHVRVEDWDLGTTEPGSSGSPLFNQDKRVVGQLHGGYAACGNDLADWYGRVSVSWTGGGTSASRLRDWLDPLNSGALVLDGRDASPFTLEIDPVHRYSCVPDDALFDVTVSTSSGFNLPVDLTVSGTPAGSSAGFTPNPVTPPGASLLTIGNTQAATPGSYELAVTGTAVTETYSVPAWLHLYDETPGAITLLTPANGATNVPAQPAFSWTAASQAGTYDLEIATDGAFNNVVHSATGLSGTSYTPPVTLATSTVYYWRVRPVNGCGQGSYSAAFSFTTLAAPGDCGLGFEPVTHYAIDFESGAPGWSSSGTGNTWALSTQRAHSGLYSYKAVGSASVSDQRLVSPPVALPAGQAPLTLQFWNYQHLESRTGGCYDGGILEISTDDGASWSQILNPALLTDPYDGPIATSFSNPLGGLNAWCGDPQDWLNSIVDVDQYAGETVRFRFRLGTDSSVSREGWYIDDVVVRSCQATAFQATLDHNGDQAGLPGSVVTHTFTLSNVGAADTYDLWVQGWVWPAWPLTSSPLTVPAGMTATITVEVAIPTEMRDVVMGSDTFTLMAASQGDPGLVLESAGTTNAVANPDAVTSGDMDGMGTAGGQISYSVGITNTGDYPDTFSVAVGPHDWAASSNQASLGPLAPGEESWLEVTVEVGEGATDSVAISFNSALDPTMVRSVTLTSWNYTATLSQPDGQTALPGETVTYAFVLENLGSDDSYELVVSGYDWPATLLTTSPVALSHGESAIISVEVEVPAGATGSDSFNLVVTSANYSELLLTAGVTTQAASAAGVELSAEVTSGWGVAGGTLTYVLTVTNSGLVADTFQVTLAGHSWQTVAEPVSVGPLAPGASTTVQVTVTVGAGQADSVTVRLTSELDAAVWAEVVLTSQTRLVFLPLLLRP